MEHLIIISSPLQALVVWLLLNSVVPLKQGKVIVCIEGSYHLPHMPGMRIINISDTRNRDCATIKNNLELMMKSVQSSLRLWVSDLFWPMNNAVYSALLDKGSLDKVTFFDEGIVLYWMERLTALRFGRELLKFAILKQRSNMSFTTPSIRPFYGNRRNGEVYALHPELLNHDALIRPIRVDFDAIGQFNKALNGDDEVLDFTQWGEGGTVALLLNQPYYRISTREKFHSLVTNATSIIRSMGYSDLYVKLHPSDSSSVFSEFYQPLGYQNILESARIPIEATLHAMRPDTALVSFNSSVLLNASAFGFRGKVISYGLDWIADQYLLQRSTILKHQPDLFRRMGVITLLDSQTTANRNTCQKV